MKQPLQDYFIFDNEKIVMDINDNSVVYYIEKDHQLIELKDEKLEKVKNIFKNNNNGKFYSTKLEILSRLNPQFYSDHNYIMNFLNYIESVIPKHLRGNFYHNIQTLKLDLNLEIISGFSKSGDENIYYDGYFGGYDAKENKITIFPETLKYFYNLSQSKNHGIDYLWESVNRVILHEMIHMASSKYDKLTDNVSSGFYNSSIDDLGVGLMEGMTEYITINGIPYPNNEIPGYAVETLIILQLMEIIGQDVMLESYFGNAGTKPLEDKLNLIINNRQMSGFLFKRIEYNYQIGKSQCPTTLLSNIQNDLINYFIQKAENMLTRGNLSQKEVNDMIDRYGSYLITPTILKNMGRDSNHFISLDEVNKKFNDFKVDINKRFSSIHK